MEEIKNDNQSQTNPVVKGNPEIKISDEQRKKDEVISSGSVPEVTTPTDQDALKKGN